MYEWLTRSAEEEIEYDVDVLFGAWPSRHVDADLGVVRERLTQAGIKKAFAISTRGALYDASQGNAETLSVVATEPGLLPVGTVDLRDVVGAARRLDALVEQGVRWLRLFTVQQGVQAASPAYQHVVDEALGRGMVLLHDGDPRRFGPALSGRGGEVIFLDLHVYLLTEFLTMARDEPGFRITTRLLSSPDGIERVVDTVGAAHLVFGSRTPFIDISPQTLRLRYAGITAADRELIAGGNIKALLEKVG